MEDKGPHFSCLIFVQLGYWGVGSTDLVGKYSQRERECVELALFFHKWLVDSTCEAIRACSFLHGNVWNYKIQFL